MNINTHGIHAKIIACVLSVGAGLSFCCSHIEIPNKIGRIPNDIIAAIDPGVVGFAQGNNPKRFKIVDGSGADKSLIQPNHGSCRNSSVTNITL